MNEHEASAHATNPSSRQSAKPANGSRAAIALACWLFSSIGVLLSLMTIVGASVVALLSAPFPEVVQSGNFYLGLGIAYAWTALAVMTRGWVSNKPVAWHWPLAGGMVGLICCIYFAAFIPLYLPCAILGIYLCYFHLIGDTSDANKE